jgi:hypothetical protein
MYLSAVGVAQSGWTVKTIPALGSSEIYYGSPYVTWDYRADGLELTQPQGESDNRVLRALLGPAPNEWTRATEIEIRNEYFPSCHGELDWLLTEPSFGTLAARRRSDEWFEIRVHFNHECRDTDTYAALNAIGRAFGFVLGHRMSVRGHEDSARGFASKCLREPERKPTRHNLLTPLGSGIAYSTGVEGLLAKAIDYFMTAEGERVAQHLFACWDTADNALPTRPAVTGICIEGLLGIPPAPADARAAEAATELTAAKSAFEAWLNSPPEGLTARLVARLRGFVGMLGQRRPIDVLREWQERGLLGVSKEDVEAWQNTRNPSAHGKLLGPAPNREALQTRMSRYYRMLNLINRILLHLVGYRGRYVDYAQEGWPEVEFPAIPQEPA